MLENASRLITIFLNGALLALWVGQICYPCTPTRQDMQYPGPQYYMPIIQQPMVPPGKFSLPQWRFSSFHDRTIRKGLLAILSLHLLHWNKLQEGRQCLFFPFYPWYSWCSAHCLAWSRVSIIYRISVYTGHAVFMGLGKRFLAKANNFSNNLPNSLLMAWFKIASTISKQTLG